MFIIAYFGGFWVYPVLKVMSSFQRGLFILGAAILGGLLYKLGEVLNSIFWPDVSPNKSNLKSKKQF